MSVIEMSVVADIELGSLVEFQYPQHRPETENENIPSRLSRTPTKCSWTPSSTEELKPMTTTQSDQIGFTVNTRFSKLRSVRVEQTFPAIFILPSLRGKVRIRLTPNPLNYIIKTAKCVIDNKETPTTLSTLSLDVRLNCLLNEIKEKGDELSADIGNIPMLQQWQMESLREYKMMMDLPFWFSKHEICSLPLYFDGTSVEFHIKLNNLYSQLIRMEVFHDGNWKKIKYNPSFLVGLSSKSTLPAMRMIGEYAKLEEEEVEYRKEKPYKWLVEDWITSTTTDSYPLGVSSAPIILTSDTPTKAIWWLAQNMEADLYNNHCNYTTDNEEVSLGWHPISEYTLWYGNHVRAKGDHNDGSRGNRRKWPSSPRDMGYQGLVYAYDLNTVDADIGIVLNALNGNQVKLDIALKDTSPFAETNDISNQESQGVPDIDAHMTNLITTKENDAKGLFKIHTLLLVQRQLRMENGKPAEVIGCKGDKTARLVRDPKAPNGNA